MSYLNSGLVGKEDLARELFEYCDWQHPSSAWYADFLCDMEE